MLPAACIRGHFWIVGSVDFTRPRKWWVVAAAEMGQIHVTVNYRMAVMVGCEGKVKYRLFLLDLDLKSSERWPQGSYFMIPDKAPTKPQMTSIHCGVLWNFLINSLKLCLHAVILTKACVFLWLTSLDPI